jgi:hypothetical protein
VPHPGDLSARLFLAALRVRPDRREAFVRSACRGDLAAADDALADLRAFAVHDDRFDRPDLRNTLARHTAPADRRVPVEELIGTVIGGRYIVDAELGRGSSGAVLRATDTASGAARAVKVFCCADDADRDAVRREVAVLRGLQVPGVVPLLDAGDEGPYAYVVMPVLGGAPFPGHARGWAAVRGPALGLLETLARVHDLGVVHRDLKPRNVLVDADGVATLLDVGASGGPEGAAPDAALAGTFEWMAPEQRAGATSARADLFAYALMVATALAGAAPFALLARGPGGGRCPAVATIDPDVPRDVAAVLDRCLLPDPAARPADAHEALAALGREVAPERLVAALRPTPSDAPYTEAELQGLFAGSVCLHHLPDDAAHQLFVRTGGDATAVSAELAAWTRSRLARRDGDRFVVTRHDLSRLEDEELHVHPRPGAGAPTPLDPAAERLVVAAVWARRDATPEVLGRALDAPADDVATQLAALVAAGRLRRDGTRFGGVGPSPAAGWPEAERVALRRRLVAALPPGASARLWNLLRIPDVPVAVVAEDALARDPEDVERQLAAITEVARLLRKRPEEHVRRELVLLDLLSLAIGTSHGARIAAAAREIDLVGDAPELTALRSLARAALWSSSGQHVRAIATLAAVPRGDDRFEFARHRVCVRCADELPDAEAGRIVEAALAWAATATSVPSAAAPKSWEGGWHFGHGRYREAAAAHERAAELATSRLQRASASTSAASAWIQVAAHARPDDPPSTVEHALARAERAVAAAGDALGSRRSATQEMHVRWRPRQVRWVRGDPTLAPDPALLQALLEFDGPTSSAGALVVEAAIAWRAGARALALRAAEEAARRWRKFGPPILATIASRLATLCGAPVDPVDVHAATSSFLGVAAPGLRLQAFALLAATEPHLATRMRPLVVAAADELGPVVASMRREVLSPKEALRYVGVP